MNIIKFEGKTPYLSAEFAFYMFSTFGFPLEMLIEEINSLSRDEFCALVVSEWEEQNGITPDMRPKIV